jgi:hypothetical protein
MDRTSSATKLVVADGHESFLKALSRVEFQRSDVVGVIHRTVERDALEEVGGKLHHLQQWYGEDSEMMRDIGGQPNAIRLLILRKS